jgi:hypothetical protein
VGLVYIRTDSGLVLAEHAQDEAAVARALREHDDELRLVRQYDLDLRVPVWKVYRYAGSDRPAQFLCAWISEDGIPLPLSHQLVEKVKQMDRNTRSAYLDEEARNAAKRERDAKQAQRDAEDLADEYRRRAGRSPAFHRGPHLRRAREGR